MSDQDILNHVWTWPQAFVAVVFCICFTVVAIVFIKEIRK